MAVARAARWLWEREGSPPGRYHDFWRRIECAFNDVNHESESAEFLLEHVLRMDRAVVRDRKPGPVRALRASADGPALAELAASNNLVETTTSGVVVWGEPGHRGKEGEERDKESSGPIDNAQFASGALSPVTSGPEAAT